MNEYIDIKPDVNVSESEYTRLLGYPSDYELEGRSRELADWARKWYNENGKPWVYSIHCGEVDLSKGVIKIGGSEFYSEQFHRQLLEAGVTSAVLVAVSAGEECEEKSRQLWQEGIPDEYFFLEIYGSAVTEHLITKTGYKLCGWADETNVAVLPHYSPGYSGWDVSDQNSLLNLIKQKSKNKLPGKINALDSGMLLPKKSQLAVFGITKNVENARRITDMIPCETCSLFSCRYRRTPYKHSRSKFERVKELQPSLKQVEEKNKIHKPVLNPDEIYSINLNALQKWADERLKVTLNDDGSVSADFLYTGTICSNIWQELEFEYHVELGKPEEKYLIKDLGIKHIGDGHLLMCDYMKAPDDLMNSYKNEKPLLGRPLSDVFNWNREFSPQGCNCIIESREYKWGIVFEVLHLKLVELGKNNFNDVRLPTNIES